MDTREEELREIWWPGPEALNDLTVDEIEGGFTFEAPDGTECADWLSYYNSTDELREQFNAALVKILTDYIRKLEQDGGQVEVPVGSEADREQAEENVPGSVA